MSTTSKIIWDFFKKQGLTDAGVAGLMGNLYAESALQSNNLQNTYEKSLGFTDEGYTKAVDNNTYSNFTHDSAGYGLAQWTYWGRKVNLLNFAKSKQKSIGDLNMQLEFLMQELNGEFKNVLTVLKSTNSILEASNKVLFDFERPANQSDSVQQKRYEYALEYYNDFSDSTDEEFSNSPLVVYTLRSPMNSGRRTHKIDTISIHCMAGNLSVETCGNIFQTKEASSNYGIGSDGRIALYVDEANRSWCTSSASNDNRAVTIEVANTVAADPWPVSDAAYKSLIDLLVDICWRNKIKRLLWQADKSLIGQVDKQNMTVHRWFAAKACPGDWLYNRHGQIAAEVNSRLEEKEKEEQEKEPIIPEPSEDEEMTYDQFKTFMKQYRQELQDNDCGAWSKEDRDWAISTNLIKGVGEIDGEPNYAWMDFLTREQAATLFHRLAQYLGKE